MPSRVRTTVLALAGDVVVVLVFAAMGRGFHGEANPVVGVLSTAWPFLVGAAAGWALPTVRRRPTALWPSGVSVWLGAYVIGMVLRALTGQGLAVTFLIVALCFLGLFILGWRVLARVLRRVAGRR
ncbi:membrane protein [Sinomonas humi]|uniref:Membrane protein n=1 Tax=Sinomonas humi TaxID=1338436 RepID=A0A0B2ANA0_9MICC|nr:membrane protein [Sinomonas humi]